MNHGACFSEIGEEQRKISTGGAIRLSDSGPFSTSQLEELMGMGGLKSYQDENEYKSYL